MPTSSSVIDRARCIAAICAPCSLWPACSSLPLLLAFWLYYGCTGARRGTTNHGELIEPLRRCRIAAAMPRCAARHVFHGHWTLVYIGAAGCDADCRATLFFMRQTRLASDNDMTRVQRVFLATAHCCDREFLGARASGPLVLDAATPPAQPLLAQFPRAAREPDAVHRRSVGQSHDALRCPADRRRVCSTT